MSGVDRHTFQPIDNLTHTLQSVEVILSTPFGSRVMRRQFGGGVAELLGRMVNERLMAIVQQLVGTAIDLWEPRLAVRKVYFSGGVDEVRRGSLNVVIEADYRPDGHLGDFTVERSLSFSVSFASGQAQSSVL